MGAAWEKIDRWLRDGGRVVAASERAARAVANSYHRARQAAGLSAWPAPNVQDWNNFVQSAWRDASSDARLVLNSLQEQSLWEQIIAGDRSQATILESSRYRLAGLAMDAHALLCSYAPKYLRASARAGWQGDAAAFSDWLSLFEEKCRAGNLLGPVRVTPELFSRLEQSSGGFKSFDRFPLLIVGFDRILPMQRMLLDAWAPWQQAELDLPATQVHYHQAANLQHELASCARWCGQQLASNADMHLLVIAQDARTLRGQMERAFLQHVGPASPIEFSLGVPLSQVDLARSALLLLRWLTQPIAEHEIDWLFSTGQTTATTEETVKLQGAMRVLRARGEQRPEWPLRAFLQHRIAAANLPAAWVDRMTIAAHQLSERARTQQHPLDWAEFIPQILERAGWPGDRSLTSAEFQALQSWQRTFELCGSLGFDGRHLHWPVFFSALSRAFDSSLFELESRNAPILIAGPAESAGLSADAIWFIGADEESWPSSGSTHPFIPLAVQRDSGMPHATTQLDWNLAHSITTRLLAAAPEVHFSYARQTDVADSRASRLVVQFAGAPIELSPENASHIVQTVTISDSGQLPFNGTKVEGGSSVLTAQSQCAFRAFAIARLGAQGWDPGEAGLSAAQRGQLLHGVLQAVWSGPPDGIRSLRDLQQITDKRAFVAAHVDRIFREQFFAHLRQRMPSRYIDLEQERLIRVVTEWLQYEATRADFSVLKTEATHTIQLAGLTFDVRLDRIDRLNDGSLLVVDYKSGDVKPSAWATPRPEDVQLPLYAEFALNSDTEELGGITFAKVRAAEPEFAGYLRDAKTTLLPTLSARSSLAKNPLSEEQRRAWRNEIEQLARDFLAGNAQADPRAYPQTCERCELQSLCRIEEPENQAQLSAAEDSEQENAPGE